MISSLRRESDPDFSLLFGAWRWKGIVTLISELQDVGIKWKRTGKGLILSGFQRDLHVHSPAVDSALAAVL